MKPAHYTHDTGYHNKNIKQSTSRMLQGGSWKKQRVVMVIPADFLIPTRVYLNHRAIIFPPNQPAHVHGAVGKEVGEAFSDSIQQILRDPVLSKWEYILTIEHDNCPPSDGLIRLLEKMEETKHRYACIGGLYWTKGYGGVPQIWGDAKDIEVNYRPQPPVPGQLVECCGTGMGFNLWQMSTFKDQQLRQPWFKTLKGKEGVATQDLYFWSDARKFGYKCAVDCSIQVGHYDFEGKFGPPDMMW